MPSDAAKLRNNIKAWLSRNGGYVVSNRGKFPAANLVPGSPKVLYDQYVIALRGVMNDIRYQEILEQFRKDSIRNKKNIFKAQVLSQLKKGIKEFKISNKVSTKKTKVSNVLSFSGRKATDMNRYMENMRWRFVREILKFLKTHKSCKVSISINAELIKYNQDEDGGILTETIENNFSGSYVDVLSQDDIENAININYAKILDLLDRYTTNGSGWTLRIILGSTLRLSKYDPLKAGAWIDLPEDIKAKKACINPFNKDNKCFMYASLINLFKADKNAERVSKYKKYENHLDFGDIQFPIRVKDIDKLEKLNEKYGWNIYGLEQNGYMSTVHPLRITGNQDRKIIPLLLIGSVDDKKNYILSHYVSIQSMSRLLSSQVSKREHNAYFCMTCCAGFNNQLKLDEHMIQHQLGRGGQEVPNLPLPGSLKSTNKFTKYNSLAKTPYYIVCDFEAILKKYRGIVEEEQATIIDNEHSACSYGIKVVCPLNPLKSRKYEFYVGEDAADKFVSRIIKITTELAKDVKTTNIEMLPLTNKEKEEFSHAKHCWVCQKEFNDKDIICRDHDHFTGKYRGPAHQSCNLNLNREGWKCPVLFHNGKNYDYHYIIKALNDEVEKFDAIAINTEKFMCINFNDARFLDSYSFLASSLDTLSSNIINPSNFKKLIKAEKFGELKNTRLSNLKTYCPNFMSEYEGLSDDNLDLIAQKGIYPYEYMDSFRRFEETELPSKEAFYSKLKQDGITDEDYELAQKVWITFGMTTMKDYHDLYLKQDTILLADIINNFLDMAYSTYGIDPLNYVSLPAYSNDCLYRMVSKLERYYVNFRGQTTKRNFSVDNFVCGEGSIEDQLASYLRVEAGLRGGVSTITHRYAKANNKYMKSYDSSKPSVFIKYLDANNLYGWAMSQYLPYGNYKDVSSNWVDRDIPSFVNFIKSVGDKDDIGYMLEVDMTYPEELHIEHNDYPLAPEHMIIDKEEISDYSSGLLNDNFKFTKCSKLIPNLKDKKNYVVHYRLLKYYLEKGLIVNKVHSVLQFYQAPWMKEYIEFNTNLRKKAKNDFEKDFFKLMNNSVFGKQMENVRNRSNIKLIHNDDKKAVKYMSKFNMTDWDSVNDNTFIINMKKTKIIFDKPIIVGFAILELSKLLMYQFHYDVMKKAYGDKIRLCMTDTDSLLYEIQTDDFYADMLVMGLQDKFDCSEYPEGHIFYSPVNKKVLGMFKDETAGEEISEFVGLRSKMYSYLLDGETKGHSRAKGISMAAKEKQLTHQKYVDALNNKVIFKADMTMIRSIKQDLKTLTVNKVGLSPYDDKRFVCADGIDTLAYGNYLI